MDVKDDSAEVSDGSENMLLETRGMAVPVIKVAKNLTKLC